MTAPNPRARRQAREHALQFLFGIEFSGASCEEALPGFWATSPAKPGVIQYAEYLIRGVCENREALDEVIDAALTNCAPERVGRVERTLLRIALFEMRYADDVPPAVAINEALEVAKRYAWHEAPRFINGVLDRLKATE